MYFSDREKSILKLLLDYRNGVEQREIQELLNISKRTLYREISSIEKSILKLKIQIVKPRGGGYRLVGEEENLAELEKQLVSEEEQPIMDSVQRQSAIAATLLLSDEEMTLDELAELFRVSVGTIHSDLLSVEKGFDAYELFVERVKGKGTIVLGGEKERRQIVSNLIYNGISEYEFFHQLRKLRDGQPFSTANFFFHLLRPENFYDAHEAVMAYAHTIFSEVTDNQLQQVIINLALLLERSETNHEIKAFTPQEKITSANQKKAEKILNQVLKQRAINISKAEVVFFAKQLEGVNYKTPQNIFLETFDVELSYQVRELIQLVSNYSLIDFRKDEALFYDLLAHMSAALKRNRTMLTMEDDPLLKKILGEYAAIYQAVQKALTEIFPHQFFTTDEEAYIVIHFATALERNDSYGGMSALVLCSSGIGTSKILENRLQKFVPEISEVQVAKISQMSHLDFCQFDLILSTVFLPGFTFPYQLISPLLLEEEVQEIRQKISEEQVGRSKEQRESSIELLEESTKESFEDIYEVMKAANELLQQFTVKQVVAKSTLEETISALMNELEGPVLEDGAKVAEQVINRYLIAPIGIPGTNFALFHSASAAVKQPYFGIYDLDRSFSIQGMDKQPIELQRILLMLAPDPMSENQQKILGKISASVIESDLNTEIYKQGNKEMIYQLLSSLFVNEIKTIG